MDLLGDVREEAGNQAAARGEGLFGAERRNAQALLLAGVPAPVIGAISAYLDGCVEVSVAMPFFGC